MRAKKTLIHCGAPQSPPPPPPPSSMLTSHKGGRHRCEKNANFRQRCAVDVVSTLNPGARGGGRRCARRRGCAFFARAGKDMSCTVRVQAGRVACWIAGPFAMAPHLAAAELDFIHVKSEDGLAPIQAHTRLKAQRDMKKHETPHLTNARKALKGKRSADAKARHRLPPASDWSGGRLEPKRQRAATQPEQHNNKHAWAHMTLTQCCSGAPAMSSRCSLSALTVPSQCPHSALTVPSQCPHVNP